MEPIPSRLSTSSQGRNRWTNDRAVIENPLTHFTDEELQADVRQYTQTHLRSVKYDDMLRAARVAKDIRMYDQIARNTEPTAGFDLPVRLTLEEKRALRRERDVPFSEHGMWVVIATVSLAALLQGFVQSSFNGASLYGKEYGLNTDTATGKHGVTKDDWRLGAANAVPWFFAAVIGCPLSLPINYWFGRRGGMAFAAIMIMCSSIGAIFVTSWTQLVGVRIVNGLGMGVKAVSTPILASETATGFWRGSAILAWQLWVAFGIMLGFAFNLIFATARDERVTFGLIQGAPLVPALVLLIMAIFFCPESPRYYLMKGPNYNPEMALYMLRRVRNTELQALRDMYSVHKSLLQEQSGSVPRSLLEARSPGFCSVMRDFLLQYVQLFQRRRLFNAVISSSVVNIAQQLCGINVIAFYSGTLFNHAGASTRIAMAYSVGLGTLNFVCALPAIKSIDTLGRRKWLLLTLPVMALLMMGGALSFTIKEESTKIGILAMFLFLFAAAYSPGMGPIPFTLASESFPLSHREAGTSFAISTNLVSAGILAMFFPSINLKFGGGGSLGFFAGLNVLAFILIFLLVEETKRRSLEDLDLVFAVSKLRFMRFQAATYLPWFIRRYLFGSHAPKPEFYHDLIWGQNKGEEKMREVVGEGVDADENEMDNMSVCSDDSRHQ